MNLLHNSGWRILPPYQPHGALQLLETLDLWQKNAPLGLGYFRRVFSYSLVSGNWILNYSLVWHIRAYLPVFYVALLSGVFSESTHRSFVSSEPESVHLYPIYICLCMSVLWAFRISPTTMPVLTFLLGSACVLAGIKLCLKFSHSVYKILILISSFLWFPLPRNEGFFVFFATKESP